jgi:phosphatidylglycerol:prolipoprotein diacylglycerol transferase
LAPLIPFIDLPDLVLVPADSFGLGRPPVALAIKPFGTLVATGVYLGAWLSLRHGRRLGLDEKTLLRFMIWVLIGGFLGGHVFDVLWYFPERALKDPLSLLWIWQGLSSFGGFSGALLGAVAFRVFTRTPILVLCDAVASAFPVGWALGRAGCAVAHDHPGLRSDAWLAVRYPGGGRFDLGLMEMALTIPLAVGFLVLRRQPRPTGFFLGLVCIVYAPLRFVLDFLRARDLPMADARYAGLTPAQWGSFALLVAGALILFRALQAPGEPPARLESVGRRARRGR